MPLENRNLEAGTRLAARYKGATHTCGVVQTEEGLRYRLEDGREFKSPSSAGSAVMNGMACNGWKFWSLAGSLKEKAPKPETKPAKGKELITKVANQKGVPEGQTRFFCQACMKSFLAEGQAIPDACPEGHKEA